MAEDSLIDLYLEKIKQPNVDHGQALLNFYNSLFDTKLNGKILAMFRKLIKLYGVKRSMNAVISAYGVENFQPESPYGMLAYFCKKDINSEAIIPNYIDLTKIEKKKHKIKFTIDPFEGDTN